MSNLYLYTKWVDEAEWLAARKLMTDEGVEFTDDVIGQIRHDDGVLQKGWCVNLALSDSKEPPKVLVDALVNPEQPKRVFCGIYENHQPVEVEPNVVKWIPATIGKPVELERIQLVKDKLLATRPSQAPLHPVLVIHPSPGDINELR